MSAAGRNPQVERAEGGPFVAALRDLGAEVCVVLWEHALPPLPAHPSLPDRSTPNEERLRPGITLHSLDLGPDDPGWARLYADVASALTALHDAGLTHGSISAHTVWVDTLGRGWLVGAAMTPGTPAHDRGQLDALFGPPDAPSDDPDARADLARRVRMRWSETPEDAPDDITHTRPDTLDVPFDELPAPNVAERGKGLFDDPHEETNWAEHTEPAEPTGPITDAARAVHRQLDVLVRLADDPTPSLSDEAFDRIPADAATVFQHALTLAPPASLLLPEVARPPSLPGKREVGVLEEVTAALTPPALVAPPLPLHTEEPAPPPTDAMARARLVLGLGVLLVLAGAALLSVSLSFRE